MQGTWRADRQLDIIKKLETQCDPRPEFKIVWLFADGTTMNDRQLAYPRSCMTNVTESWRRLS